MILFLKIFFIFLLQWTYNIIFISCSHPSDQTLYNLQSDHPIKSRTHLTPYVVIRILSIIFSMLYFTSPRLFCSTNLYFLIPSPFLPFSPKPPSSCKCQNVPCIYESVSVLLLCLFCFLDSIIDRYAFVAILLFIFLMNII